MLTIDDECGKFFLAISVKSESGLLIGPVCNDMGQLHSHSPSELVPP